MKTSNRKEQGVIDLGKASIETKGAAGLDIDVSNGKLYFMTGIVED